MWKIAINYAWGTGQVGDFSACSYLLFLLKNIDCKSILQKIEIQEQFSVRLTAQTSLLENVAPYVSPKCVSVWLFIVETLYVPLEFSLELFITHCGKPKFINLPVKFSAAKSKFQFCTTARSKHIIIFTRTVLPCLCFFSKSSGRNNAKHAFQYTFKNNTTQCAKQEEEN